MKKVLFVFLVVVNLVPIKADSLEEQRRKILSFGIDSDLKELIVSLKQEKNVQFVQEIKGIFEQTHDDGLKDQILLYFLDLEQKGLEEAVLALLKEPEEKSNSLLLNIISYLTAVKAQNAGERLAALIDDKNKVLAVAAIRGLGKLQAGEYAQKLREKLSNADDDLKPDLIWSLGELKSREASEELMKEYKDAELSQPLLCQSLLEAFGKIADPQFWPMIEKALTDPHVLIRAKAIACLASYSDHKEVTQRLLWALRDSQAAVRQAAAEAAFVLKPNELKDILLFRIQKDPDFKVRVACLKAIAQYDQGLWHDALMNIIRSPTTDPQFWKETLQVLLNSKASGLNQALLEVIEREKQDKRSALLTQLSAVILDRKDPLLHEVYAPILTTKNATARGYILRAIYAQQKKEFLPDIRRLFSQDKDPNVRSLAASIVKEWEPDSKKD